MNRIDRKEKVTVGSIDQWISLRADDVANPIILFLHGGPGTALISFSRKPERSLEKDFLVVNWDQRGAGRSYSRGIRKEDMTIERFVADAEELVEILLRRFNQEKLFLAGSSWGSIVGMKLAAKRPDLLRAYIGIGQIVEMNRGEEISYLFTLNAAKSLGNEKALRELTSIGHPPYKKLNHGGIQRKWLSKFHGATYEGSLVGTLLRNFSLRDTRFLDPYRFVRGAMLSLSCLEDEQNQVNLMAEIPAVEVPVYFCSGRKDYNVPFELSEEYLEKLRAPKKQMIWFDRSGHLPNFEEPEKFRDFCASLLREAPAGSEGRRR